MRRWMCIFAIVVSGGFGAFLAAGYGTDSRGEWWVGSHLEIIREQLGVVGQHLLAYRQTHGRYPTNDEGLAALDDFEVRIAATVHALPVPRLGGAEGFSLRYSRFGWTMIKPALREHRRRLGRPPQDLEELAPLGLDAALGLEPSPQGESRPVVVDVAIDRADNLLLLCPAGVLSPWLLPYVYENRNGLDPDLCRGSPADADPKRRYSVRVDEGVYVYSIGGRLYAEEMDRLWWERNRPRFFGAALLAAALVLTVVLAVRRGRRGRAAPVVLLAAAFAGAGGHFLGQVTCYVMAPLFYERDAKMVARQRALLDTYHRRGVIGDEAYDRAVAALKLEPTTRPATAPSEQP